MEPMSPIRLGGNPFLSRMARRVFTKTREAARRVYVSVGRYLTRKLKLVVNRQKSRVCRTDGVEFLGFEMHGYGGQIRVSAKNVKKFKERSREILNRNRGISMTQRLKELRQYVQGWMGYFAIEQRKSLSRDLDKWLRRRLRACYWKQWRKPSITRAEKPRQKSAKVFAARQRCTT